MLRIWCVSAIVVLGLVVVGCNPPPTCATSMPARLTNVGTSPTNVFKMSIPANPTLAPNSAAIISRQLTQMSGEGTEVACSFNEWDAPVFYTDASQTRNTYIRLHLDGNPSWGGATQCGPMRWKSCVSAGNSSDGPAWVIDTVDRCFYEFWMLNKNVLIADPEAGWAGGLPLDDATQVWEPYEGLGGTAGMPLSYSSSVWPSEVSTSFNHGFMFAAPWPVNNPSKIVAPFWHTDGSGTSNDDLFQGMRVQLNPSYDISALPTYKRSIAQAMKTFGMYDGNSCGGHWAIGGPNPQGYTNNCWNGVLPSTVVSAGYFRVVPTAQFRVLAVSAYNTPPAGAKISNNSCLAYQGTGVGAAPTISTISPASGPAGTVVTLTGTNMSNPYDVRFDNTAATNLTALSATQVRCTVPAGSGTVKVTYRTTNGGLSNIKTYSY